MHPGGQEFESPWVHIIVFAYRLLEIKYKNCTILYAFAHNISFKNLLQTDLTFVWRLVITQMLYRNENITVKEERFYPIYSVKSDHRYNLTDRKHYGKLAKRIMSEPAE